VVEFFSHFDLGVVFELDGVHDMHPERSVAAGGVKFMVVHEKALVAASTLVDPYVLGAPVSAGERSLHGAMLGDVVLIR
jgi:hypothetical protein